jgi:hypothetical protein
VSDLLIFPPPNTLLVDINYSFFPGSSTASTAQFAMPAITNGRRHLGALRPRYGDREQFITPRIDVTSLDKV